MKGDTLFRELGAWVREVAGWLLILLGLFFFYESWRMLAPPTEGYQLAQTDGGPMMVPVKPEYPRIFEAPVVAIIGFVIFRGGIHLLKVAVAARVTQQASRELEEAARRPRLPLPKAAPARK
jgi:hypothetical protein